MLRVSVSHLDAWRDYCSDEESKPEELVERLRGGGPQTPAMLAGSAFHEGLETMQPGEFDSFAIGDYRFDFEADIWIDGPAIREMKVTRDFEIDGVLVRLVGKVDGLHGGTIYDHKLTGHYDPDRYMESYQWRAYLLMFGAWRFVYNVFEAKETEPKWYTVRAGHPLVLYGYANMEADVKRELRGLLGFVKRHCPDLIGNPGAASAPDYGD